MTSRSLEIQIEAGALVRADILKRYQAGEIKTDPPLDSLQVRPNAIDLRLGYTFRVPKLWKLTPRGREAVKLDFFGQEEEQFETVTLEEGQVFDLLPQEWVNATALEKITMPEDLIALMFPRSGVTRRGMAVDSTGLVDAHYSGSLLIPIRNNTGQVITLYPGQRISQLAFLSLSGSADFDESRWANTDIIVGGKSEKNEEEETLIKAGKIRDLKKRYGLVVPPNKKS